MVGTSPDRIVEIHGTVDRGELSLHRGWQGPMEETLDSAPPCRRGGPRVPRAAGRLKSATISFGQNLVPEDLMVSQLAAAEADESRDSCDAWHPVAGLPGIVLKTARASSSSTPRTPFDDWASVVRRDQSATSSPR